MELEDLKIMKARLPLPFRLNHVNCYFAKSDEGWMIIDAGLGYQDTRDEWESVLQINELKPSEIKSIFLTHFHPDHYGFLGELQQWTGAKVYMNRKTFELTQREWTEGREEYQYQYKKKNFALCGIPSSIIEVVLANHIKFFDWVRPLAAVEKFIDEGHSFQFGELTYRTIRTDGHAEGHMCLINEQEKVLIAGDHLLLKTSPNVAYHFMGDDNPLKSYLDSLHKLREFDIQYVIPGHGSPFSNCNERIDEILYHHENRLAFTMEILKNGIDRSSNKKNVFEVCQSLFDRELNEHEIFFAIGETMAHLQYLLHQGKIKKEHINDLLYFSVS